MSIRNRETPSIPFAVAKAAGERLHEEYRAIAKIVSAFPRHPNGLVLESVRVTPEYQAAKGRAAEAFAALRRFNAAYVKLYAKELRDEQDKKRGR